MRRVNDTLWMLCLLCLPLMASAQEAGPVRQVVPYTGHLDRDGAPFDGVAALRFRVYFDAADEAFVWEEAHPAVNVRSGRFAVRLGELPVPEGQPGIVDLAAAGAQLYLELAVGQAVEEGVEPEWTRLAGRQAIHPVPQAVWSATATHLPVARLHNPGDDPVTVDDDLVVTGVMTVPMVRADGDAPLSVESDLAITGEATMAGGLAVGPEGGSRLEIEPSEAGVVINGPAGESGLVINGMTRMQSSPDGTIVLDVGNIDANHLTLGQADWTTRVRGAIRGPDGVLQVNGNMRATGNIRSASANIGVVRTDTLTLRGQVINRLDQFGNGYSARDGVVNSGLDTDNGLCFLTEVNFSGDCIVEAQGGTWRLRSIGGSNCAMRCIHWRG